MSEMKSAELVMPGFEPETPVEKAVEAAEAVVKEVEPIIVDDSMLTEQERATVNDFSKKIDIDDAAMVMQYGASAQRKLSEFSESALGNVRTKDFGEVGDMITDLVGELKGFDVEEKGLFGFLKKGANKLSTLVTRYDKTPGG